MGLALSADSFFPRNARDSYYYSITNEDFLSFSGAFRIDALVGIIYVNATLDRESIPFHNLTVAATDGGYPPNSATVYVGIDVLDINDNSPIFTNQTYFVAVHENVSVGFVIAQVVYVSVPWNMFIDGVYDAPSPRDGWKTQSFKSFIQSLRVYRKL